LRAAHEVQGSASLSVGGEALAPEADFLLGSDLRTAAVDVTGQLVFAGFGVVAPSTSTTTSRGWI